MAAPIVMAKTAIGGTRVFFVLLSRAPLLSARPMGSTKDAQSAIRGNTLSVSKTNERRLTGAAIR
jgi:hypothetical protein